MFAIANDRKSLWQWDLNQQLTVAGDCTEVHYLDRGTPSTLTVEVKDGKADIPNILLQKAGRLVVYAYIIDEQDHHTKICETFGILARPKPNDYVYTETEVKTWSDLQAQIGNLADLATDEKGSLVAAINEAAQSGGGEGTKNVVLYIKQDLSDEQKNQARKNIGAQDENNGLTPVRYFCTDGTYTVDDTVYVESGHITSPSPSEVVSSELRLAFRWLNIWQSFADESTAAEEIRRYKLLVDNGYLEYGTKWYAAPDKSRYKEITLDGKYVVFSFDKGAREAAGYVTYSIAEDKVSFNFRTAFYTSLYANQNQIIYNRVKMYNDPVNDKEIATKKYVDSSIAAGNAGGGGKLETFDGMQLLASGTIASGTAAGTITDTEVTYGAFKQWHRVIFIRRCASEQANFSNGYGADNDAGFRSSRANLSVTLEHIDGYLWKYWYHATDTAPYATPTTEIQELTGTLWTPAVGNVTNCDIGEGYIDIRINNKNSFSDDNTFVIKNWAALTADVIWYIYGLTKEIHT